MMKRCNIWIYAACMVVFVALLPALVGCNASDEAAVTAETPSVPQHLKLRFRVLQHRDGKLTIQDDALDKEDYVQRLLLMNMKEGSLQKTLSDTAKAITANRSETYTVSATANWKTVIGAVDQNYRKWFFVANLTPADVNSVKGSPSLAGVTLETRYYLRGYNRISALHPLVMVDTVPTAAFVEADADGVRLFKRPVGDKKKDTVKLERIFSRFSYEAYPLPSGYVIKKVTVERIPDHFALQGDLTSFGTLNGLVLWDNNLPPGDQPFAKWQRSRWTDDLDPHPDMYLSGHFYLPPCKVDSTQNFFGTNERGGMPVMRFVFTDNQHRTFVRLYRLGNSGKPKRGYIERNKHYNVRINLLGPYKERADTDTDLRPFDEVLPGSSNTRFKAAFVN